MCRGVNKGDWLTVKVRIPADLSHNLKAHWSEEKIDRCIAPIVNALQKSGIDMRGSCCGHGKTFGEITLQDRRALLILNAEQYRNAKKQGYLYFGFPMCNPKEIIIL